MWAKASGSSNFVASPIAIGARKSNTFFSPKPSSGKLSGRGPRFDNVKSSLNGFNPSSRSE